MILFPIVCAVAPTPAAVLARLDGYLRAHSAVSAKFTYKSVKSSGAGTITIRFNSGTPNQVEWTYVGDNQRVKFVASGGLGISINQTRSSYDRGAVGLVPTPSSNVFHPNAYPTFLVGRGFDPVAFSKAKGSVRPLPGGGDRLTYVQVHPGAATSQVDFDIDSQGRILRMQVAEPPDPGYVFTFTDYRVDRAALPSSFDVEPPVGDVPFAFDESYAPIHAGEGVPPIPLGGSSPTNLVAISRKPTFVAFLDDPIPPGLLDSLKRINQFVPVAIVTLGSTRPAGLTTYTASEADFDHAGIEATPQFYLVGGGKVTQAWLGFQQAKASSFEAEVKAILRGAG